MKNILILSLARHDDVNTSTTFELAREFSRSNNVLIVEHPYTWTELLRGLNKRKGWVRLLASLSPRPIIKSKGSVKVMVPPAVLPSNFLSPGKWYDRLSKINHNTIAQRVNKWLLMENWKKYDYINSYNYHFPHLSKNLIVQPTRHAYHCVDPIVKPYTIKHGLRNQKKAVYNADMVICTAPQLQREWEPFKPSFTVANGVDYKHFNSPQKYAPAVRTLGNKVVGYFGAIERRIDFDMLIATFRSNPSWTLVLAGPVQDQYVPLEIKEMTNVHFTGKYSYDELPSLIFSVDATIIPFKMDDASKSIYPLKLYEYMSTGKPIVSTLFNSDLLIPIADNVRLARTSEDLEQAIAVALDEKDVEMQLARKSFASTNTWEHRAERFLNYLNREKDAQVEKSH